MLRFPLEEKILPSNFEEFYGLISFSLLKLFSMKIKMALASYQTLGFES
jgi:hypothetical protein